MAEDVKAGGGVDGGGHGAGVERVADAEGGFEGAVSDACLRFFGYKVEDGGAGRFATCTSGGRDGDEGGKGFRYGKATAAVRRFQLSRLSKNADLDFEVKIHKLYRSTKRG